MRPLYLLLLVLGLGLLGCAVDTGPADADPDLGEAADPAGKADSPTAASPFFLTGAFDGSQPFEAWVESLRFARGIKASHGKTLHFTYFVNTVHYDRTITGATIDGAATRDEEIIRIALTQQAINEGHEIGNHTVRHVDGTKWSQAQWGAALGEFDDWAHRTFFQPVRDAAGDFVFPRFQPLAGAEAGQTGAACSTDADCQSGTCAPLSEKLAVCTTTCNQSHACPSGLVCGLPLTNEYLDYCLPKPVLPIEHQGQVLFDAEGQPNLAHPALRPYGIVGIRAPYLAYSAGLYGALVEHGYSYDTSQIVSPGAPTRLGDARLFEFGLMRNPGTAAIPMDYNYLANHASGDRMLADYQSSILAMYGRNQPWNIGHHMSRYGDGQYRQAMWLAFEFAAAGCPDGSGAARCPNIEFPSFRELAKRLK